MAVIQTLNELARFGMCLVDGVRYECGVTRKLFTWASIAYILTYIFV